MLDADGDVLAAAILHVGAAPAASDCEPQARSASSPAVGELLEGQRAAAQVWALHAERTRRRQQRRACAGCCWRSCATCASSRSCWRGNWRACARRAPAPPIERRALAQLTRDIHAPLANRLGIWQLKWELEDLAFRYLEPETYQRIARLLDDKRGGRERYIDEVNAHARATRWPRRASRAEVAGRPKHIYSIWRKMQQQERCRFGELYDLRAVRVLVDDVADCYAALGVVHALWPPCRASSTTTSRGPRATTTARCTRR